MNDKDWILNPLQIAGDLVTPSSSFLHADEGLKDSKDLHIHILNPAQHTDL